MTVTQRDTLRAYLSRHADLLYGPMALDSEEVDPDINLYDWDLAIDPVEDEPADVLLSALWHGCQHNLDHAALIAHLRTIPELNAAFTLE